MLHKHQSVFAQAKTSFEKGKPTDWSRKFFCIVDTRVASFREINFMHNDRRKYFCDHCSLPLDYPEQCLNYPERMDRACACQNMRFQASLDNWMATPIPHWH